MKTLPTKKEVDEFYAAYGTTNFYVMDADKKVKEILTQLYKEGF